MTGFTFRHIDLSYESLVETGSNDNILKFYSFSDKRNAVKPPVGDFTLKGEGNSKQSNCIEIAGSLQIQNFKYKLPQY